MPLAPNLFALKRRLDRYFWQNRSAEMALLNQVFDEHFLRFDRVAVVGGLVRDFAREGRAGFRSDVDLVIEASAASVAEVAERLGGTSNRFGGHGVKVGAWKIDFWALETTWAARHAGVAVSRLEDITKCTFFDSDAVAYDLRTRRVLCSPSYLDRLAGAELDVNLGATPSPQGNLLRSMRRLVLWRYRSGPGLRRFIEEHLDEDNFQAVRAAEAKLFSLPVSTTWSNAASARRALLADERDPLQLLLGFDEAADGRARANECSLDACTSSAPSSSSPQ